MSGRGRAMDKDYRGGRGGGPYRGRRGPGGTGGPGGAGFAGGRGDSFRGRGSNQDRGQSRGSGGGDFRGRGGRGRGGFGPPAAAQVFLPGQSVSAPDSAVTQIEDALVLDNASSAMAQLAVTAGETRVTARPGYGTMGQPVLVRTNYFRLRIKNAVEFHRYSVNIVPEAKSKAKKRRLLSILLEQVDFKSARAATDFAATIVSTKPLQAVGDSKEYEIIYHEARELPFVAKTQGEPEHVTKARERRTHRLMVTKNAVLSIDELAKYLNSKSHTDFSVKEESIQALNIVINQHANASSDLTAVGKGKFYPVIPNSNGFETLDLGGGLAALRGYYSSVRTAPGRILLNVNVASASFYKDVCLLDLMEEFMNVRQGSGAPSIMALDRFIAGLLVESRYMIEKDADGKPVMNGGKPKHNIRVHKVFGLIEPRNPKWWTSKTVKFEYCLEDGEPRQITVEQYFWITYKIRLNHSDRPVVNVGSKDHPNYVPPELLFVIPGQPSKRVLSPNQTSQMIRFAARRPHQNAESIVKQGLAVLGIGKSDAYGVAADQNMLTCPGRILEAPKVHYADTKTIDVHAGSWNLIQARFPKPVTIGKWAVLLLSMGKRGPFAIDFDEDQVFRNIPLEFRKYGIRIEDYDRRSRIMIDLNHDRKTMDQQLKSALDKMSKSGISLVFALLSSEDRYIYSRLKYFGDVVFGISTQAMVGKKLEGGKGRLGQYLGNIALKVNLRLGGTNHFVNFEQGTLLPTDMLVGIDATHPSPGSSDNAPTIVAMVASVDSEFSQYPCSLRIQTGKKEMVEALTEMMVERLRLYEKKNGRLPERILVYRDGVSEGQYEMVLTDEKPKLDAALEKIYGKSTRWPKLMILIVGKRHHTRFYPTKQEDCHTSGNPRPGLVVDRGITMERGWDFFMQPHAGLQGTTRPAHYVALYSQWNLTADQLEQLTHKLCYCWGRATKAVSLCPPAYWADVAAERGRAYLHTSFNDASSSSDFEARTAEWTRDVHGNLAELMFYV